MCPHLQLCYLCSQFDDPACDACASSPCMNGAYCINLADIQPSYQCLCLPGYTGNQCQTSNCNLFNLQQQQKIAMTR